MHNYFQLLDDETSNIVKDAEKLIKINSRVTLNLLEHDISRSELRFFPQLTLLAARQGKSLDEKKKTVALLTLLMYISTQIHSKIPNGEIVKQSNAFQDKVQLPILVGDLIYSKSLDLLFTKDCFDYLDDFIHYVESSNLGWINFIENKISKEELCLKIYGEMGKISMKIGAMASGLPDQLVDSIGRSGFAVGNIFGARKLNLPNKFIKRQLKALNISLEEIDVTEIKDSLTYILDSLYQEYKEEQFLAPLLEVAAVSGR